MRRRVFLCYSPKDSVQAGAFQSRWSEKLVVERGASLNDRPRVTIVLIGLVTVDDDEAMGTIIGRLAQGDGVIGIRLDSNVTVPDALHNAGCEIFDIDSLEIPDACDRAFLAVRRAPAIKEAALNTASADEECARAPTVVVQSDRVPIPDVGEPAESPELDGEVEVEAPEVDSARAGSEP